MSKSFPVGNKKPVRIPVTEDLASEDESESEFEDGSMYTDEDLINKINALVGESQKADEGKESRLDEPVNMDPVPSDAGLPGAENEDDYLLVGDVQALPDEKEKMSEVYEDFIEKERICRTKFEHCKETVGLNDEKTLIAALNLADQWIGLYKLKECDELLSSIFDYCTEKKGSYEIRCVQSLAFTRFKQFRFQESLELMIKQRELVGNCVELCENIGHVYNSLGHPDKAEEEFKEALRIVELDMVSPQRKGKIGGILLGLGQIKQTQRKFVEALDYLQRAMVSYKQFYQHDHSLIAKTLMYIGGVYERMRHLKEAEEYYRECIRVFVVTCGEDTPLTASAWKHLSDVLIMRNKKIEAEKYMKKAIDKEVTFNPLRLNTVCELLMKLLDIQTHKDTIEEKRSPALVAVAAKACEQARLQGLPEDGNLAVLYKTSGEIMLLGGDFVYPKPILEDAVRIFERVTELDCTKLIESCKTMLVFCNSTEAKRLATEARNNPSSRLFVEAKSTRSK